MKLEKLVGERFKERPADCVIDSHAIMVKGGYIKYMANGIYSSYLPLRRIVRKIEQILREEMDKIDGQEVQFPGSPVTEKVQRAEITRITKYKNRGVQMLCVRVQEFS